MLLYTNIIIQGKKISLWLDYLAVGMAFLFLVLCDKPTLPELIKMKLPSRVGPKLQTFSTLLLQDEFGDVVPNIVEDCRGKTEKVTMEVLREWLAGKGVEVSWESLIATLRDCELSLMATQIQMALEKLRTGFV